MPWINKYLDFRKTEPPLNVYRSVLYKLGVKTKPGISKSKEDGGGGGGRKLIQSRIFPATILQSRKCLSPQPAKPSVGNVRSRDMARYTYLRPDSIYPAKPINEREIDKL